MKNTPIVDGSEFAAVWSETQRFHEKPKAVIPSEARNLSSISNSPGLHERTRVVVQPRKTNHEHRSRLARVFDFTLNCQL